MCSQMSFQSGALNNTKHPEQRLILLKSRKEYIESTIAALQDQYYIIECEISELVGEITDPCDGCDREEGCEKKKGAKKECNYFMTFDLERKQKGNT
jgi:hypothetical protein